VEQKEFKRCSCPCCTTFFTPPNITKSIDKEQEEALHRICKILLEDSRELTQEEIRDMNRYTKKRYTKITD